MSEFLSAFLLGIVEGLTEFIPVSSTAHLILFGETIGFSGEKASVFEVFIQLGAILAVVFLYLGRFKGLLRLNSKQGFQGWQGIFKLGVACFPALVCGALFHKVIKAKLFAPGPVAIALVLGGVVMIAIEQRKLIPRILKVDDLTVKVCFWIGVFQCLSLWPGVSRAGSTIVGAMLLGVERKVAAEFSFLVAVPIMIAAVGYDLLKGLHLLSVADVTVFAIGFVTSFITAIFAIRVFVGILQRYTLSGFGIYRIFLGLLVLWML